MPNPIVRQPIVIGNFEVEGENTPVQEIEPGYRKTLAHHVGLDGVNLNMSRVYPGGGQLVQGIDLARHESIVTTGTLSGGPDDIDLGSVFNFHQLIMQADSAAVKFSTDGITFRSFYHMEGTSNLNGLGFDQSIGSFWATTQFIQVIAFAGNSNALYSLTSWKV